MLLHFTITCLFTLPFTIIALGTLQGSNSTSIAKPGCPTKCGDVTVPYPFGIGTACSLNEWFYLTCNESSDSDKTPQLFINGGGTNRTYNLSGRSYEYRSKLRIHSISDSELRIFNSASVTCYQQDGNISFENNSRTEFYLSLYQLFSLSEKNKLTVIGCYDLGLITGGIEENSLASGCIGLCNTTMDMPDDGQCSGRGCCQTSITKGFDYYDVTVESVESPKSLWESNRCSYAFVGEEGSFEFHGIRDLFNNNASEVVERIDSTVPVVFDWVINATKNCSEATECKDNSECYDVDGGRGYRCRCNKGYKGNAYLEQGCQDIDECAANSNIPCYGLCNNTAGSYTCTCKEEGYTGDANRKDGCQPIAKGSKFPVTIFTLALVFGLVAISSVVFGIFFGTRKRKLIKLREKFFEQNGGLFLKQKLNAPGISESVTMFTAEQLQKATDNYSEAQIIGRGGHGVVYKGILPDKRVVAVKKSKLVDGTQAEQFINEVLILTQVIHRNVVKLLGCCLEEEVPVLVYEFISNNTLFYHIHHRSGGTSWLSWENRLRVSTEAASALGYLHSQASMPIIHRDVKSTNILLDDNYTTKISDFGASRLVPLDHDQVTTLVQGTLGYLDPEYFHTSQLTDKSDVYSFGVVLAELVTGLKPLGAYRTDDEKNLATYFVRAVKESRLFEIVEPRVLSEGTLEQLQAVGDLVKRCLSLHGNDRPTMKEVAMELEGLKRFKTHPWSQNQTHEESRSLILEVEQYGTSEWESSSSASMTFQESKPR